MKFRFPAVLCMAISFCIAKHGSGQINFFTIANGDVAGLKNALTASNSDNKDDIINLATNGTYTLSAVDNVTNGANGLPVIGADGNHSVTIHGHGSTITRSGSTPFRILQCAASSSVFIDNLTISNALIANFGPGDALGAAIYNNGSGAALTLTTCTFNSNSTQGANGGDGISGEPNGNNGDGGEGGALYSTGALTVTGCTFTNNSAVGGKGGNAFFSGGGNGGVGGTGNGGAIVTFGSPVMIASCTFTGNTATGGNGGNSPGGGTAGSGASAAGGAISGGYTDTTVTKCVFSNSSATAGQSGTGNQFGNVPGQSYGGALDLRGTITESTLTNNTAQNGGALLVGPLFFGEAATTTVTGCLFQNNSASIEGGAVHVTYLDSGLLGVSQGFLAMSNCTISGDIAPHGAAVFNAGKASLVNCTLVGNNSSGSGAGSLETNSTGIDLTNSILKTGTTGANVASNGIASHGHNISNDNAAGLLTATGDLPNTDPLFISDTPQDYGGPTKTIAIGLFGSSPAIDHGDPTYAPRRDQRGYFRNGLPDTGAFEYQGSVIGNVTGIARTGLNLADITVSFEAVDRLTYKLQRKLNITDATWQDINGANELTATANDVEPITAPGDVSLGKAFYRVTFVSGP